MNATHSLVLYFAAPLQSWGASSRFRSRETESIPTKSGVIGLLANALGRTREDRIDDLADGLEIAARSEQQGTLLRDFQTARALDDGGKTRLSMRYYLSDARFLVAIGGEDERLLELQDALRRPARPLYLGRRSCPANWNLLAGSGEDSLHPDDAIWTGDPRTVLHGASWRASEKARRRAPRIVHLQMLADARQGEASDVLRDEPLSFNPEHRDYGDRSVIRMQVTIENPDGRPVPAADPFFEEVSRS